MDNVLKKKPVNVEDMHAYNRVLSNLGIVNEAICSTAGDTAAKTITLGATFKLENKATVIVTFTNGISVANATLAITHTTMSGTEITETAKPIYLNGAALSANVVPEGAILILRYNGTSFNIVGGANTNAGSEGEAAYTPTLSSAPTESTLTYVKDGETHNFEIGQFCRVADADAPLGYKFYQLYDIALNGTVAKWSACATKMTPSYTAPTAPLTTPVYDGTPQPILEGGSSADGNIQYSMDGSTWSSTIPTVTDAGTYTVYWRLQGDGIHSDVPPTAVTVTMLPKEVENPDITLSISEYTYDGNACTPTVTIKDDDDNTIPSDQYTVTYSNNTNAGTATVTITDNGGNYSFSGSTTFTIDKATPTVTAPTAKTLTYTGSAQALINAGSTDWGTLQYSLDGTNYSTNIPDGTNADTYTVYYKVVGNSNVNDVAALTVSVTIDKAAPTYIAPTAKNGLIYSGSALDLLNAGSTNHGTIQYSADGSTWSTSIPQGTNADDYTPQWKLVGDSNHNDVAATTINVSIAKVTPTVVAPTAKILTYSGSALELLNAGSTNFGTLQYSEDETNWSTTIPSKTNAGSYTMYYRVLGDSNINSISSTSVSVSIAKANPTYTAPTAKSGLVYNATAQELLNAGSTSDGTISYSEDGENWNSSVPSKTNAGDYAVYWKLTGDANHNDVVSTAINVSIAKVTPTVIAPTAKSLTYNTQVQELLNAGSTNWGTLKYSDDGTTYGTTIPSETNAGTYTLYYKVEGDDNINDTVPVEISVTVAKVTPTVTAPTAKSLTYDGTAQELVNAGSTDFGTLQYSLDDETYGTSIPSGTNAGDYTVYYKVVGDSNINDVAAQSVSCSIGKANRNVTISGNSSTLELGTTNTITVTTSGSPTTTVTSSNTSVATVSGMTVTTAGKGTTTITVTVAGDSNYNEYTYSYTLTVTYPKHNGYEYVDLGLPSGTKWATMNVGASRETDYGNFYMYGKGSRTYNSSDSNYTGTENPLSYSVDTARQVWGGSWHMPTYDQLVELATKTALAFATIDGVYGVKCTAKDGSGNYIFLPTAGYWNDGNRYAEGTSSCFWTSNPKSSSSTAATCFFFTSSGVSYNNWSRKYGFSVRPVFG